MILIYNLLRSDSFCLRLDRNGDSVFIRTAYKFHILALEPQIPDIYVGRYVAAGKMANVYWSVGIGKSGGY
jgi:hypothetical protein